MHQFQTRHAELKGFSDYFGREVQPILVERDSERERAVRKGIIGGLIAAACFGAIGAGLFFIIEETFFGFMAWMVGFMSIFGVFWMMTFDIREETKGRIVGSIVGYIGWTFESDVSIYDLTPFLTHFLLPKKYDRSQFEDRISGEVHGATFESVEAHLEQRTRDSKGRESWTTVFRGQIIRLDFPTRTFGRTVVLRDRKWFNKKKRADMKRVGLADPVFEKMFEAYGTDQVEARVILDPAFMQRMVDLEQSVDGKKIRFAFCDNDLFIAVETKNRYEAGSMFKPLDDPARTQKILDEIGAIYDIVDTLLK